MTASTIPHPPIVSRDQWLGERRKLLAHEKECTRQYDRINAERRRLPMVKVEKDYIFDGPNGTTLSKTCLRATGNLSSVISWLIGVAERLPRLQALCDRHRRSVDAQRPRQDVCAGVVRSAGQARCLQGERDGFFGGFPYSAAISTTTFRPPAMRRFSGRIQLSKQGRAGGKERPQCHRGRGARVQCFRFALATRSSTPIRSTRAAPSV